MRQLIFNLTPAIVVAPPLIAHGGGDKCALAGVINLQPHREGVLANTMHPCENSMGFDFPGRLAIDRRPGQFQYRYGRKVQPRDEYFDRKYKIGDYD